MAKIKNPITFSKQYNIPKNKLEKMGIFDPTINVDTKLFIDPLLLENSNYPEISKARKSFNKFFETIILLLSKSKTNNDVAWRNAKRILQFGEVSGICLGYGAASIQGSGFGPYLSDNLIKTAKEIIDLGIDDPDLFLVLALFEEGIGPDRISDMTANIIIEDLHNFNNRICSELKIPLKRYILNSKDVEFPPNQLDTNIPIILLPKDILRDLPIARDWSEVQDAAYKNQETRDKLNNAIGNIWTVKSKKMKSLIKDQLKTNKSVFKAMLDAIHNADKTPYNYKTDPEGHVTWHKYIREINDISFKKWQNKKLSISEIKELVDEILKQFKYLVEKKGLWKEFWAGNKYRPEKSAQRLFFACADSFCKANDLDISPEADSGRGPVDFKVSQGNKKVLVEIKLSNNTNLIPGYVNQLELYKESEETKHAVYLIIDLGDFDKKEKGLLKVKNEYSGKKYTLSEIFIIDGSQKLSASKVKKLSN